MSINTFLFLLFVFSALTSLIVEGIKKNFLSSDNKKYNLIVLIVALIVGFVGILVFYYLNHMVFNADTYILAVLMGVSSALSSMTSYDKVKQAIEQFGK